MGLFPEVSILQQNCTISQVPSMASPLKRFSAIGTVTFFQNRLEKSKFSELPIALKGTRSTKISNRFHSILIANQRKRINIDCGIISTPWIRK